MEIFNNLSTPAIREIPQVFRAKADSLFFKKGQVVYQEGNTPLGAYFVEKGSVKITKVSSLGKEQIVKIVTSSQLLSFSDLFSSARYNHSAQTIEESTFLFIPKQDFWNVLKEHNDIFWQLLVQLSLEMNMVEEKVLDLAYKPVRGRLADAILSLSSKDNTAGADSSPVCLTRTDLAGYIGTVKETINRLLSELRNEKIIHTSGSCIKILDREALGRISKMYN